MIRSIFHTWRFIQKHPFASRNKSEAVRRWLRWQIGSRILKQPVIMPFVKDAVLAVEHGMTGATGNIYCGLHEFADMAVVIHALRQDDLFLDIGANVGSYTILAGKVAGAKCLTVEPAPDTFTRLCRNLKLNGLEQQAETHQCAVGSATGTIRFALDQDTTNQVVDEHYSGRAADVPVRTIDELLNGRASVVWKIDVEGYEREVLCGAIESLRGPLLNVVLLESDDTELTNTMVNSGFTRCAYDPFTRRIIANTSRGESENNLWVRNPTILEKRCQSAPRISLWGSEF